jgi:hypothetical protein
VSLSAPTLVPASPAATRLRRARWRDWRLLAGVVVLLGCTALGARLAAAADDTVSTWAAATALVPGTPVDEQAFVAVPVRLDSATNPYLTGPVPSGYVVARSVAPGELVPAAALVPAAESADSTRLVSVAVDPTSLPGRLGAGDRVDVWKAPDDLASDRAAAELLAEGVAVAEVPSLEAGFTGSGQQPVVLSVQASAAAGGLTSLVADLVSASAAGRVVLTADPGSR